MTMRERIKTLCKERGITAQKLEKDCGFANGYISKLDRSTPNGSKLRIIADYFGITVDSLYGKAPETECDMLTEYLQDEQIRRLVLFAGGNLPQQNREKYVDALIKTIQTLTELSK